MPTSITHEMPPPSRTCRPAASGPNVTVRVSRGPRHSHASQHEQTAQLDSTRWLYGPVLLTSTCGATALQHSVIPCSTSSVTIASCGSAEGGHAKLGVVGSEGQWSGPSGRGPASAPGPWSM